MAVESPLHILLPSSLLNTLRPFVGCANILRSIIGYTGNDSHISSIQLYITVKLVAYRMEVLQRKLIFSFVHLANIFTLEIRFCALATSGLLYHMHWNSKCCVFLFSNTNYMDT